MSIIDLNVELREAKGKNANRQLRMQGQVPGVVYGHGDPVNVAIKTHDIKIALEEGDGMRTVLRLKGLNGEEPTVMVKELQRDPVKETKLIHADLTRVSMDQKIQMEVPVQTVGTSPGVKLGGVMNILQRSLRIWVTPSNIPEVIDIDISELEVNDKLFVKDLTLPDGMKVADREDEVVLICLPPRAMRGAKGVAESDLLPGEEGAEEGAEGDAEPEVIGKGKQEEEGE